MSVQVKQMIGKYEVIRTLGQGAMGTVYLGNDPRLDRLVAIKVIRKDFLDKDQSDQAIARFQNEARSAGRLQHPGIVAVYDYGEDESSSFIVMEYAPGDDLEEHIKKYMPMALGDVASLMYQLLDALQTAHSFGVVHRDIKPSNLIITAGKLKITDFGIARISSTKLTQTGLYVGTPLYMAPEQYSGGGTDHRSDLFSAAVVLYELVTGKKPFDGDSIHALAYKICHVDPVPPSKHNKFLPPGMDACVLRGLAKDKEHRYQSSFEFNKAIAEAVAGRIPVTPPWGLTPNLGAGLDKVSTTNSRPPPPAVHLSPEDLDRVTQAMATFVGPMARVHVKKTAPQSSDVRDLCGRLLEHFNTDAERVAFLRKLGIS